MEENRKTAVRVDRIRVFVDFWNFQLSLNDREGSDFRIDWIVVGRVLARLAADTVGLKEHSFEGMSVYTSYDPKTEAGKKYRNWATVWLDRQPGINVECRERQARKPPRCPSCHELISECPHCAERIAGTIEKGVDTLLATDMIRMAWEDAYEIAVLVTSDADLVPAVEFLDLRARKVVQAGFPPLGVHLATKCWASFDVYQHREAFRRSP